MTIEEGGRSIKQNLTLNTKEQSISMLIFLHQAQKGYRDFKEILGALIEIFL